jgi:hypothetical protein
MRRPRIRHTAFVGALLAAALLVVGCAGATKSSFARAAEDAGGGFAAAAVTLADLHAGRLTREYAAATLGVLEAQLASAPEELRSAEGSPGADVSARVADLAAGAAAALERPCLDEGCDWRAQVDALEAAGRALADASSR